MGCVFRRGNKLWIKFKDANGKWVRSSSGFDAGQEPLARALLVEVEAGLANRAATATIEAATATEPTVPTLADFAVGWLAEREARGVRTCKDERARLRNHILPLLGSRRLDEIKVRDVRDLVAGLRRGDLAPKTVRHVYDTLRGLYRDALEDEVVISTPCVLRKRTLPPLVDKDPTWRARAVYSKAEVEQLISDDRIPLDRRVIYALLGVGGLRTGEAAGLRWGRWDPDVRPLGRIEVVTSYDTGRTKTGKPRNVPVHPTLAAVLAEWKLSGWAAAVGRAPTADDLVVPVVNRARVRTNTMRKADLVWRDCQDDLDALGLRRRRVHDLRRAMISLARADGARKDLLEVVTHARRGDIVDVYTEFPWEVLCAEVAKLRIERRAAEIVELRAVAVAGGGAGAGFLVGLDEDPPSHNPGHSHPESLAIPGGRLASPAGFEPALPA